MKRNQPKTRVDEATQSEDKVTDRERNECQTRNPTQSTRRNAVCSLSVYGVSPLLSVWRGEVKSSIAENGIGLGTAYAVMRVSTVKAKVVLTARVCCSTVLYMTGKCSYAEAMQGFCC